MGWNPLKSVKNLWKKAEDLGHKAGIDKDHIGSVVAPVTTALTGSTILGTLAGQLTNPDRGIIKNLNSAILGKTFGGDFGNKITTIIKEGKIPNLGHTIQKVLSNPTDLLKNVLVTGGDIKKGLLMTLAKTNPTIAKFSGYLEKALGNITGINLKDFGINDATALYGTIKYLKSHPPDPPDVADLQQMTPELVQDRLDSYKTQMQEQNKENLQNVRDQFNARGMYRSGMELAQERKTGEDMANKITDYKSNLEQQALQYNNKIKQDLYNEQMQRYGVDSGIYNNKMDNLGNLIAGASRNSNLLGGIFNQNNGGNQSYTDMILQNIMNKYKNTNQEPQNSGGAQDNITIPDINLNDQINTNQDNYTDDLNFINLYPSRQNRAPQNMVQQNMVQQNRAPQNSPIENNGSGNNWFRNSMTSQRFTDEQAKYNKEMQDNQNKYRQSLLNKYKGQWKPGTVLPVGFTNGRDMNGKGTFYYIDKNGNMQGIDNGGFRANMRGTNTFDDEFKNIFGYDYNTYNRNKLIEQYKNSKLNATNITSPSGLINSTLLNGGNLDRILAAIKQQRQTPQSELIKRREKFIPVYKGR